MRAVLHTSQGDVAFQEYARRDENLIVPATGTFVRLKHWDELGRGDNVDEYPEMFTPNPVNAGDPPKLVAVDPAGKKYDYVEMPDEWQWFLWRFWDWASQHTLPRGKIESFYQRPNNDRTFARTTPGSLTYVYVDMVEAHRAFTEAGSPEAGSKDVVTGRNPGAKGYEWLFNPTGGAMVRVLRTLGIYYEIEALDVLKPPPSIEYVAARPWLYFWCTQYGKFSGSTRFPQIKTANAVHGLPEAGTSSPLLSKGGRLRVLKSATVPLVNGQPWSPYKPVKR